MRPAGRGELTTLQDGKLGTLFVVDAHRDDGRRFIVRSDEPLSQPSGDFDVAARLRTCSKMDPFMQQHSNIRPRLFSAIIDRQLVS